MTRPLKPEVHLLAEWYLLGWVLGDRFQTAAVAFGGKPFGSADELSLMLDHLGVRLQDLPDASASLCLAGYEDFLVGRIQAYLLPVDQDASVLPAAQWRRTSQHGE